MSAYRIISAEKARTPISVAWELLGVSRSGYHAWERRGPSDRALSDAWLLERIKQVHAENRQVYGSRRVQAELRLGHGIQVSRKRVQRLMRAAAISGLVARKRGRTTIRVPGVRVADDRRCPKNRVHSTINLCGQVLPSTDAALVDALDAIYAQCDWGDHAAGRAGQLNEHVGSSSFNAWLGSEAQAKAAGYAT